MSHLFGQQHGMIDGQDESAGTDLDPTSEDRQRRHRREELVESSRIDPAVPQTKEIETQFLRELCSLNQLGETGLDGVSDVLTQDHTKAHFDALPV